MEDFVQMPSKTRIFFLNALSLTLTALIMRGVGVAFNIYISNRAGSEVMGLYSLLGSVYGFSITLATAGINLGTTRLVSDALGIGDTSLARACVKRAMLCCIISGSLATALLFSLSPFIASKILGDIRAIRSLRILASTLVPIAVCSCLSGYFTAVRRVKINAAFQILIQLSKIACTVFLLSMLLDKGTEEACIALVLGGAISEFVSLLITYSLYRHDLRQISTAATESTCEQPRGITKKLLSITLPVTFSACIRSALTMFQHVLVPKGLKANGRSWSAALSSYGALHGMALPVVLFPSAFISAFSGLLIPEVSECVVQKNSMRLQRVAYRSLTLSLIFSMGISGIMLFFSRELGILIYNSEETAEYIRILAPLIPVMYIDSAVDAILKGSGHQVYSMNVNIADALTSCILALTLIPKLGITGYIISIYATEILNTTLSLYKMITVSKMHPKVFHQVFMPVLCIIGATNGAKLLLMPTNEIRFGIWSLILHILLTVTLYLLLLRATGTLGCDEMELLQASLLSEKRYDEKYRSHIEKNKYPAS